MKYVPTRIAGAQIVRQHSQRRLDGSTVIRRQSISEPLPYEESVTAEFAYLCEPSFSRSKLLRTFCCVEGEIYVCLVDVRVGSPSYGHWQGIYLSEGDARSLLVPAGVACGWQVLSDTATVELHASRKLDPTQWAWLRWNDRELGVEWPEPPSQLATHVRPSRRFQRFSEQQLPRYLRDPQSETVTKPVKVGRQANKLPKAIMRSSKTDNQTSTVRPVTRERNLILVIGSSGQLGRDLCRHLRKLGTVVGACRTPDKGSLLPVPVFVDVSRPASLRQAIRHVRPTLIVNAAGLTDIDQAEAEPRLAQLVNATAPAIIAEEVQRVNAGLVHFCSGMVYGGSGERPWRESDAPNPQNQYARTKLIGTEAVRSSGVAHLILRGGWLYSTHGENYVRRLIDSLTYRNTVTLASDHFGSPTSTDWLSAIASQLLGNAKRDIAGWMLEHGGLYHASTLGYASKLEFGDQALAICRQHALPIVSQNLRGQSLAELPSAAKIPANSRLDASRIAMKFGIELPHWRQQLNHYIGLMLDSPNLRERSVA